MIDQKHCRSHASELKERNDCVVRALSIALQIDYPAMHEYLESCGRKHGDGMMNSEWIEALRGLGVHMTRLDGPKFTSRLVFVEGSYWREAHYRCVRRFAAHGKGYKSLTVATLAKELTTGTYIVSVDGHVLCMVDGHVHDWTKGRRHRVLNVFKIETNGDEK